MLRRDLRSGGEAHSSKLGARYRTRAFSHPVAVGEPVLRNRRNGVLHVSVRVSYVIESGVVGVPAAVVVIVDGGAVDHRVGIVHPTEIAGADAVSREIGLTRSQGEPPDRRRGIAGREAHAKSRAASVSPNPAH